MKTLRFFIMLCVFFGAYYNPLIVHSQYIKTTTPPIVGGDIKSCNFFDWLQIGHDKYYFTKDVSFKTVPQDSFFLVFKIRLINNSDEDHSLDISFCFEFDEDQEALPQYDISSKWFKTKNKIIPKKTELDVKLVFIVPENLEMGTPEKHEIGTLFYSVSDKVCEFITFLTTFRMGKAKRYHYPLLSLEEAIEHTVDSLQNAKIKPYEFWWILRPAIERDRKTGGWLEQERENMNNYLNRFKDYLEKGRMEEFSVMAQSNLAEIYYNTGEWEKAVEEFKTLVEKYPESRFAKNQLSLSQDLDSVVYEIRYWNDYLQQQTDHRSQAYGHYSLGEVYWHFLRKHPILGGNNFYDYSLSFYHYKVVYEDYFDSPWSDIAEYRYVNWYECVQRSEENDRNYMVIELFQNFLDKYPNSEYKAELQFRIGDLYFYNECEMDGYFSKGDKARIEYIAKARDEYFRVMKLYPNSEYAYKAKSRIDVCEKILSNPDKFNLKKCLNYDKYNETE